jgi:hypothetical protein
MSESNAPKSLKALTTSLLRGQGAANLAKAVEEDSELVEDDLLVEEDEGDFLTYTPNIVWGKLGEVLGDQEGTDQERLNALADILADSSRILKRLAKEKVDIVVADGVIIELDGAPDLMERLCKEGLLVKGGDGD